jgi:hypothetical protein
LATDRGWAVLYDAGMSARSTRATDELSRLGIAYVLHEYAPPVRHGAARDERSAYGLEAAAALGVAPDRICKTLVAIVDGQPVLAIVPWRNPKTRAPIGRGSSRFVAQVKPVAVV